MENQMNRMMEDLIWSIEKSDVHFHVPVSRELVMTCGYSGVEGLKINFEIAGDEIMEVRSVSFSMLQSSWVDIPITENDNKIIINFINNNYEEEYKKAIQPV